MVFADYMLGLLFYPEYGGSIFLRNVSELHGVASQKIFTPGERAPGTYWIGGWVDLRADLDDLEKRKFLTLSNSNPSVL
jgi:hypothetical protein